MSYRNKAEKKKNYAKSNQAKKSNALRDEKGTFKWEGVRGRRKKKYLTSFSDTKAKARKAMTSDKAYALPFGETFRQARKEGKKTFRWKSKQYHTKTKAELEKAIGAKEKERFARAGAAKTSTSKKANIFSKIATKLRGGYSTQKGYEEARAGRSKAKRIAKMEKRKEAGKSYSAKNLASLKGDTGAKKTLITKKDKKGSYITKVPGKGWRKDIQIPGIKRA